MPTETSTAIVQAFGEAMNHKDASFLDAHPGLGASKPFFNQLWIAFPDVRNTVETRLTEGEWVAQRMTISATMQGAFMGMQPTGKHATWEVLNMFRVVDGKIMEYHAQSDTLGMMKQLGIGPAGARPSA
jgi:predicted ester cyclase